MPEFLQLSTPTEALETLLRTLPKRQLAMEVIETTQGLGRVTALNVGASHSLPEFKRSTMDGYAVCAHETFGASESLPGYLTLIGETPMGEVPAFSLMPNTCALIHTGGMLPDGADAVVALESTQKILKAHEKNNSIIGGIEIEISRAVAEGENVLNVGEDVIKDQIVLESGKRIRPVEIGGCKALGINQLRVVIKPKIGIISSGDEVISPTLNPRPGQVRDVNSYSLAAMVEQEGGEPILYGIVSDKLDAMKSIGSKALAECDAVVITAGSSASARDITAEAIAGLGNPGILVHGVNVRPGKPTILAVCNGKVVIGLPGNPVSALVIGGLFVVPVIHWLLGLKYLSLHPSVQAELSVNISSLAGREDWVGVKLVENENRSSGLARIRYLAEPVFGKSNLIFSLVAADGMVRIPPEANGLSAGEVVEVFLSLG
jgi:molybdopterin molybdotransferase